MKLIIVRHGEADSEGDDTTRHLTESGRADIRRMSALISSTGWKVKEIRSSPVLRARETAGLIAAEISRTGDSVENTEEPLLAPGVDPATTRALLNGDRGSDALIWVFHSPDVKRVSGYLTGLSAESFYFPPGTMLALNLAPAHPEEQAILIWIMQPEYIENLVEL